MAFSNPRQLRLPLISTRLKEIDATRAHLLRQLAELDIESGALLTEHGSIINGNAAISTLPNEVLSTIFELGHSSQHADARHFEILVSSVTKHWRDVALRTPRLWSVISYANCAQPQLEPIAVYLRRSKAAPIDLRIRIGAGNMFSQHVADDLCQLLTPHFHRCRRLFVNFGCLEEFTKLLDCLHDISAPLLQSIDIICPEFDEFDEDDRAPPAQIFTGGTPLLTSIRLENIGLQHCLPPLGSVNTIYLRGWVGDSSDITADEWVKIISSATSLIHLEMDGDTIVNDWAVSATVEMPRLQTLSIRAVGEGESTFHGILECINAPRLEVLVLKNFGAEDIHEIRPNPFPLLHTLILQDIHPSSEGFESLQKVVAAFPHIQHVACSAVEDYESDIYKDFLSLLTPGRDPTLMRMPRLRSIVLPSAARWRHFIPWAAVRDMLVARKAIGQPIRTLFVAESRLQEVSVLFPPKEGVVQVEVWKSELVQGWPAIMPASTASPSNMMPQPSSPIQERPPPMNRFLNGMPWQLWPMPPNSQMLNGASPVSLQGAQVPMPNGAPATMTFPMGPSPQHNGMSGSTPGGGQSSSINFQPMIPAQRPGGPQPRGPTNGPPFQSPAMAHSPQNSGGVQPQPPAMGQLGPSPHLSMQRGSTNMPPQNGAQGPQQVQNAGFQHMQRPAGHTVSPSNMMPQPGPSMQARPSPMGTIPSLAQEQSLNNELSKIPRDFLASLKHEAGLGDRDIQALNVEEKQRLVLMARQRMRPGPGGNNNNAVAGPSVLPTQLQQQQQRGNERNSTSSSEEHPSNDPSPPEHQRPRRPPMGAEQGGLPMHVMGYPPQPQQGGPGGLQPMPSGLMRPMGAPGMNGYPQGGMQGMGGNPGMSMQGMGVPPMGGPPQMSLMGTSQQQQQQRQMQQYQQEQHYRQSMQSMHQSRIPPGALGNASSPPVGGAGLGPHFVGGGLQNPWMNQNIPIGLGMMPSPSPATAPPTPTITGPSPSALLSGPPLTMSQPSQVTPSTVDPMAATFGGEDFINSMLLDAFDFDDAAFKGAIDVDFERDFGHWFRPENDVSEVLG